MDKANILVVDDEPENLLIMKAALNDPLYQLFLIETAEEAKSIIGNHHFALILLDVDLPGMNGFEFAQWLREWEGEAHHTPIIFVTAYRTTVEDALAGYATLAIDYIQKPLNLQILRTKVAILVDLDRKNMQIQAQAHELAELNAELFHYTSSISQDLQATLKMIHQDVVTLRTSIRHDLDEEQHQHVDSLQHSLQSARLLVSNLNHLAQLDMEVPPPESVALAEMIQALTAPFQRLPRIQIESSKEWPTLITQRALLYQALQNILTDVLHFYTNDPQRLILDWQRNDGGPLGPSISIRVSSHRIDESADGQQKESKTALATGLHQPESSQPESNHIGFAITRKALKRLEGTLRQVSEAGARSFEIEIPIRELS